MKESFNLPLPPEPIASALEKAVALGNGIAVLKLLKDHPSLARHVYAGGNTVLHLTAQLHDGGKALQEALALNGAVHAANANGETPLLLAAVAGDGVSIGILLQSGAPLHAFDSEGHNATMRAIRSGNLDAATALLIAGGLVDFEDSSVEEQIGAAWEKILPEFCIALDARQKQQGAEETQSLKNAKADRIKAAIRQGSPKTRAPKTASFTKK